MNHASAAPPFVLGLLAALAAGAAAFAPRGRALASPPEAPAAAPPFALVELFTSEGCSSCPPADAQLARVAEQARRDGSRVFALSFHVDYWNDLGWPDPFSSAAHSRRQGDYARAFGAGSRVYTPQMVVNGREEFVGSDAARADRAIAQSLARPATVAVTARAAWSPDGASVRVRYETAGAPAGASVAVALVEASRESRPPRGENAGRALRHANVVRAFAVAPGASGERVLAAPPGVARARASVVVYVQDDATRAVLGASAAAIPPA